MALIVKGYNKQDRKEKVLELIDKVGLTNQQNQKTIKLSGGEKQRTVIARALAKDSPIIVCDEPTGNLDTTSSKTVLKLLHEISKDRLVLVVTHDFNEIKEFASRKIRLYDGEIVEDIIFRESNLIEEKSIANKYYIKLFDVLTIGLRNVLAVPRKSFFIMIIMMFMILAFFFAYGSSLSERNKPYASNTPFFVNADKSRLIVTNRGELAFTDEQLETINNIDYVRTVINNDLVFDSTLVNQIYNDEYQFEEFYHYKIISVHALEEFDLISGKLPTKSNEVIIGNNGLYDIGDVIQLSNRALIREIPGAVTDQYEFKVVGIVDQTLNLENPTHLIYLTNDAIEEISIVSFFENSQVFIEVTGVAKYDIINERWITIDIDEDVLNGTGEYSIVNKIWIDDTLEDNQILAYDMMFFDICRDFGYKEEMADDFDAGLCGVEEFIDSHLITFAVVTVFENKKVFENVEFLSTPLLENIYGNGLYMNEDTYRHFFSDDTFQVTAVVYDMYEANIAKEELEDLGFNVFYPAGVIDEDDAINIVLNNIKLSLILGVTIVIVYFVGYFVLRNIIVSKKKDYIIYRSLGTSKKTINLVLFTEIIYLSSISFCIVLSGLLINEQFNTSIPRLLRYFSFSNYIVILMSIIFMMVIMTFNFNRRIFNSSVISSLKGS